MRASSTINRLRNKLYVLMDHSRLLALQREPDVAEIENINSKIREIEIQIEAVRAEAKRKRAK